MNLQCERKVDQPANFSMIFIRLQDAQITYIVLLHLLETLFLLQHSKQQEISIRLSLNS